MARSFLAPGEEVVRTTRRHLSVLGGSALQTLVAVAALGAVGYLSDPPSEADLVDQVCGGLAVVVVLRFALRLRRWSHNKFLVTDRRIVEVGGFMARRVWSWPYVRIHDLGLRRTVMGRLLGYGSVVIEATIPDSPSVVLGRIPDPNGFYRDVMEVLMEGPLPELVEVDDDSDDEIPWWEQVPDDETDTGPLPRIVV